MILSEGLFPHSYQSSFLIYFFDNFSFYLLIVVFWFLLVLIFQYKSGFKKVVYNNLHKMYKKTQSFFLVLIIILALSTVVSTSYSKYCQSTIDGSTPSAQSGTTYVQDSDEFIQLSSTQILLDMRSQIQSEGTVAYSYYLQAGATVYNLKVVKAGTDGQQQLTLTIPTTIVTSKTAAQAVAMFLGGESGVVALQQTSTTINFYQLSTTSLTLGGFHTINPAATQTLVKIITGNGQSATPAYYFLTKDPASAQAFLFTIPGDYDASQWSINMANKLNFVFACPTGFLQIDSTPSNTGPILYQATGSNPLSSTAITGTAPTFVTATGTNRNYDVVVLDFDDKFFVAMYDESYASSVMFQIYTVSTTPTYGAVADTAMADGITLSYQTDFTGNFLQISTAVGGTITAINLYFVDSYVSASQHSHKYSTPASPTGDDQNILDDLSKTGLNNLKVSFSSVASGGNNYYNLFILKVAPSTTSIVRYRTLLTGSSTTALNSLSSALAKDYQMNLSNDAQTLFNGGSGDVQVITFEISCTCTVTTISQFICFGASLECTVAIQNLNLDCTKDSAGDFSITVGDH